MNVEEVLSDRDRDIIVLALAQLLNFDTLLDAFGYTYDEIHALAHDVREGVK